MSEQAGAELAQMAMRWRDDGEQLAVVMHNKMVMTVWAGGLEMKGKVE